MELLWTSDINQYYDFEEIENMTDDEHQELSDMNYEMLSQLFGQNEYEYSARMVGYRNNYGMKQRLGGCTKFCKNIAELVYEIGGSSTLRIDISKGKYNHLIITRYHHDGVENYEVFRLNKRGQERLYNYYDEFDMFDNTKPTCHLDYVSVSVWNDFK